MKTNRVFQYLIALDIEKDMGAMSVEILFERMMLLEMRQLVKEIGGDTFAEMKSYSQPPLTAVQIVDILIEMFLAKTKDQFNNWNSKKLVRFLLFEKDWNCATIVSIADTKMEVL